METTKVKKKAGRISPTPMGDYDNTTTYRRLDWVYYGGTSYICKKNNTLGISPPTDTDKWQKILELPTELNIIFDEATERENISSGEKLSVILGKIKKCISDIKTVAFTGSYNDLLDTPTMPTVNNGILTIQKNGTNVQTFSSNQLTNATANIIVPTTATDIEAVAISKIMSTKEQVNANTDVNNVAGAVAVKNMVSELNSNLTVKFATFNIDNDAMYTDSTVSAKCFVLPDSIIIQAIGSIHVKKTLERNDILGSFNFPYQVNDFNILGYEDAVATEDAQTLVVLTVRNGGELVTRGKITAGRWIGFFGLVLSGKSNCVA